MDRRYEGNLINASENKKKGKDYCSCKTCSTNYYFFLSRGDTAAKLCIKSLHKPHKALKGETLICLLLPMHLIIPQCDLIVLLSYLYTASFDFPSRLECTELDCDVFFAVRHEHPRTRWKKPVSSFVFFMANTLFIEKYIRRNSKTSPNDQQNLNSYLTN